MSACVPKLNFQWITITWHWISEKIEYKKNFKKLIWPSKKSKIYRYCVTKKNVTLSNFTLDLLAPFNNHEAKLCWPTGAKANVNAERALCILVG